MDQELDSRDWVSMSTQRIVSGRQSVDDCPFCHVNTQVVIEENDLFRAIYNQSPIVPGHSLVVPQYHVPRLLDMGADDIPGFFSFARQVTSLLVNVYDADGFDWIIQEGEAAGQTVPHLHLHVIPRLSGDLGSPGSWFEKLTGTRVAVDSADRRKLSREEMRNEVRFIQSRI